ncbi:MAG TPA: hypothetical protein VIK34_06810 [Clostridiaceae bacterium]
MENKQPKRRNHATSAMIGVVGYTTKLMIYSFIRLVFSGLIACTRFSHLEAIGEGERARANTLRETDFY